MPQSMLGGPKKAAPATAGKPLASAGAKTAAPAKGVPSNNQAHGGEKPTPRFMMSGQQAKQAIVDDDARAQAARDAAGKAFRFYIKRGTKDARQIVFLDGFLDADGALEPRSWWEHTVKLNGQFTDYVCTADVPPEYGGGPCPLCKSGNDRHLMFGLSVIDLTPYEVKKGEKAGQVIPFSRKLFACKKRTFAQLQVFAQKYAESHQLTGLRGLRFDVTRTGDMAPSVGDNFIVDAFYNEEELAEHFGELAEALDIESEVVFYPPDELVKMGVAEAVEVTKVPGPSGDFTNDL